jgi:membrane protein
MPPRKRQRLANASVPGFTAKTSRAGSLTLELSRHSFREFLEDHGPQFAAAISYYVLFSIFPLAILLVAIAGLLLQEESARQAVVDAILANVPLFDNGASRLEDTLASVAENPGALGVLGLAGLVWSASGMMGAIRIALSLAWDAKPRPFIRGKLLDLLVLLGAALLVLTSLALTAVGRLTDELSRDLGGILLLGWASTLAAVVVAVLAPLLLSLMTFAFAYRVLPSATTTLGDIWPGALVGALAFESAKHLFALYLENFSRYDVVYGSLGAIVAFLFFVFLAANVLLLGAEVASEWPRVREKRAGEPA